MTKRIIYGSKEGKQLTDINRFFAVVVFLEEACPKNYFVFADSDYYHSISKFGRYLVFCSVSNINISISIDKASDDQ